MRHYLGADLFSKDEEVRSDINIHQHGRVWVCKCKNWIGSGLTREEAIENYREIASRDVDILSEKVENDLAESRRKHQELWNY